MLNEDFYRIAADQFAIAGPAISEDRINAVLPGQFSGKDDLVEFYLRYNGGSRTKYGGTFHCGNRAHKASRDDLEKVFLEGFYSIPLDAEETMPGVRSMIRYLNSRVQTFDKIDEMKSFLKTHRPIAFEHGGDDFWIDLQSGCIRLVFWNTWKEGPIEIAGFFREFVEKYWNIPRDRWPVYTPPCGLGMAGK